MKIILIVFCILNLVRCPKENQRNEKAKNEIVQEKKSRADLIHEFCMSTPQKLFDHYNQLIIQFNLEEAYRTSPSQLGEGAFGKVAEICYPSQKNILSGKLTTEQAKTWPQTVAVKQVKIDETTMREIQILLSISKNGYGPKFYGCFVDKKNQLVYTVQEKLSGDFFDSDVKTAFDNLPNYKKIMFYEQLFLQAIKLYKDGFINNDIKLDNMLFDTTQTKLYIIDFGLATTTNQPLLKGGTFLYLTPEKLKPKRSDNIGKLEDDLYSLAISIVYVEGGQRTVYKSNTGTYECMEMKLYTESCIKLIRDNSIQILETNGYPKAERDIDKLKSKKNDLNFTELIYLILHFRGVTLTEDNVLTSLGKAIANKRINNLRLDYQKAASQLSCPKLDAKKLLI